MAVARRNPRRGNQNQQQAPAPAPAPPAPPQPQPAPVAPVQPPAPVAPPPAPPPAPRPATPRTAVELAAMRLIGRGEEMLEEAERRDNARRIELEEAERRRQAFWRTVRMVVGNLDSHRNRRHGDHVHHGDPDAPGFPTPVARGHHDHPAHPHEHQHHLRM